MFRISACAVFFVCLFVPFSSFASPSFIQWHSENIQHLRGWDYELGPEQRSIITFEHANKWAYGDFFMFTDITHFSEGHSNVYAELSPRVSFSKVTGLDFSYGPVKDVFLSNTLEWPEGLPERYLYGVGINWDIPGFRFFKSDLYVRNNTSLEDSTYQFTLAWNYPFEVKGLYFLLEGFADFAGGEDTLEANQLIVPRMLLDIGSLMGHIQNCLFSGVEYSYWRHKFGIRGTTESVAQFQIKWVF